MRPKYIYEHDGWPHFSWNMNRVAGLLAETRGLQGCLIGKISALGFELRSEAFLETMTFDVIKSTEIEGINLDWAEVRSSVALRLGIDRGGGRPASRDVDGIVEVMLDATGNFRSQLTAERLFGWHSALFPTGRSGMRRITVGGWRTDENGPMQVVSGALGREKVHYQAPPAATLEHEMRVFLEWFNAENSLDPVIMAAIAHLWFVTLHPFDDGNGRIARAITDMLLAAADDIPERFYSMSLAIRQERDTYYRVLEQVQKGGLDITDWIVWFLETLQQSIRLSELTLRAVIRKHSFWNKYGRCIKNPRQERVLQILLDGFKGNLTSSKWAKITKCSQDTALRDIQDLVNKGILTKSAAGGRSTKYELDFMDE
jgi:Fic family protein